MGQNIIITLPLHSTFAFLFCLFCFRVFWGVFLVVGGKGLLLCPACKILGPLPGIKQSLNPLEHQGSATLMLFYIWFPSIVKVRIIIPFSWKGNWSNEKWNVLLWSRGLLVTKPGLNSTFLTPNPATSNCSSGAAICLFPTCLMPDTIPC